MLTLNRFIITLLAIGLLSACGWQLRGQVSLPPALRILTVSFESVGYDSQNAIKQALLRNGVTMAADAEHSLIIHSDQASKRTLAVTSSAKASEYELKQTLTFSLKTSEGAVVIDKAKVETYQTLLYDPEAEIGKALEEENLRKDMKNSNAYKLLLRIKGLAQP